MNEVQRQLLASIRAMTSEAAAGYLIEEYPGSETIDLLRHRSWTKSDQDRLARYYLRRLPFASSRPYEVFLSFMSVRNFVNHLDRLLPYIAGQDLSLLLYHVEPLLNQAATSPSDQAAAATFLSQARERTIP
jgi:hypothetical protein